jgi:hypothetical protein
MQPFAMPLFSFRTENGERTSASEACELAGHDEAWIELTRVCGDLVGAGCRNLKPNSEWRIDLLDAADAPLFRIRLVAETLVQPFVMAKAIPLTSEPPLSI